MIKSVICIFICFLFVFSGLDLQQALGAENKDLKGKKILMIIAKKDFRDEEFQLPKEIFEKHGARIIVASSLLKNSVGMLGTSVKPDILIENVNVADYDAIVFVGGVGASEYWNDARAHNIIKEAVRQKKVLGAICIAPVILANADVLKDKKATVWKFEAKRLQSKGAKYTDSNIEVDDRIVTANGPDVAKDFGEKIVDVMIGKR